MSDLTSIEKRKLERLFGMGSGYVLDFSNRTFEEFVLETTRREIYANPQYDYGSSHSKANRLRGFWSVESNYLVGKLIGALIDYGEANESFQNGGAFVLVEECRRIGARLAQGSPVPEIEALSAPADERDFETLAQQVQEAIQKNQPESGLDRLHTFVVKYVRKLCEERGIAVPREKPLHSFFGEYVKHLRAKGHLQSEMTERILKSAISVLEAFNNVRNEQSLAHDNPILNYDESLLIFNHVASLIRFIRSLEERINRAQLRDAAATVDADIPF